VTQAVYPATPAERTSWILARRDKRNAVTRDQPVAFFIEQERNGAGEIEDLATILLASKECPWKCLMCDLWRNTTSTGVTSTADQIRYALDRLGPARSIKLYNSGSFFDAGAIAPGEWPEIARLVRNFANVIVECHPRLVNERVSKFASLLAGDLEVAMGLETCHPTALEALNKRFTPSDYRRAASFLTSHNIGIRTFLLVHPPFVSNRDHNHWLNRSIEFASESGSGVISLIPLRHGNGAVDLLAPEPSLQELEAAQEAGILRKGKARIFADTWDLERFSNCADCLQARTERLVRMNHSQTLEPRILCASCNGQ
jgi:archaeosine synthase beta-subunit